VAEPLDRGLREAWAKAFLRQGNSDLETFLFLSAPASSKVPTCHRLQFLQMACEKIAKAYRIGASKQVRSTACARLSIYARRASAGRCPGTANDASSLRDALETDERIPSAGCSATAALRAAAEGWLLVDAALGLRLDDRARWRV
jgi:hypothetical protein